MNDNDRIADDYLRRRIELERKEIGMSDAYRSFIHREVSRILYERQLESMNREKLNMLEVAERFKKYSK
jgi:hypothetical protein